MIFRFLLSAILCLTLTPLHAATIPQQVTSPLTTRGDALDKDNQLGDWAAFQWGGRALIRAGEPVPLDGQPDTLRLAALELGGDLTLLGRIDLHALILYEQQITDPPQLDELYAHIRISPRLQLRAGRQYVPFGNYDTALINMPLTQYLGETRAEALSLICECNDRHLALFTANPDQTDQPILGFNVGLIHGALEANLSVINNLAGADLFDGARNLPGPTATGLHLQWSHARWIAHVEWIGALERFDPAVMTWRGRGARPHALVAELRLTTQLLDHPTDLAFSHQRSHEAISAGLPESRWMSTIRWHLNPQISAALEWMLDQQYTHTDGGNGQIDQRITAELSIQF